MMICLIQVTKFLLSRQLNHLQERFLEEGGIRERMTRARLRRRNSGGSGTQGT